MYMTIGIDKELLTQMKATCEQVGTTVNYAFYTFARHFVAHGSFPFELTLPEPEWEAFASEEEVLEFCDAMFGEVMAGEEVEIRLPIDTFEWLEIRSRNENKSIDELILDALENYGESNQGE